MTFFTHWVICSSYPEIDNANLNGTLWTFKIVISFKIISAWWDYGIKRYEYMCYIADSLVNYLWQFNKETKFLPNRRVVLRKFSETY